MKNHFSKLNIIQNQIQITKFETNVIIIINYFI
jgi:hypothetical protein